MRRTSDSTYLRKKSEKIPNIHNLEETADTISEIIITKGDIHEPDIRKRVIRTERSAFR